LCFLPFIEHVMLVAQRLARKLCPECKQQVEPVKKICPTCGIVLDSEWEYCGGCGSLAIEKNKKSARALESLQKMQDIDEEELIEEEALNF
jgi:predicted amidophosphoribosyltransferase